MRMSIGRYIVLRMDITDLRLFFKSKLLQIHPTKSCFLLFKNNKMQTAIENEIKQQPLNCDDFTARKSSKDKWLGDMLSDGGLIKSVEATVKSR